MLSLTNLTLKIVCVSYISLTTYRQWVFSGIVCAQKRERQKNTQNCPLNWHETKNNSYCVTVKSHTCHLGIALLDGNLLFLSKKTPMSVQRHKHYLVRYVCTVLSQCTVVTVQYLKMVKLCVFKFNMFCWNTSIDFTSIFLVDLT